MFPFPAPCSLVMACHFTGIFDVNRTGVLPDDDYSLVKDWAESVAGLGLNGIIFHNNFSEATCARFGNDRIRFIRVALDSRFNPNVYRYFVYRDFLDAHATNIHNLFVTDVSDVVALRDPFSQPLFCDHPEALFCGDEPKCLQNDWMTAHAENLRNQIAGYADYEAQSQSETLLNCGIIGGRLSVMQPFLNELWAIHHRYNSNNTTAFTGDMGAFNFLVRTRYNHRLIHGAPVNTPFKAYDLENAECWFRHK